MISSVFKALILRRATVLARQPLLLPRLQFSLCYTQLLL